MSFLIYYFFFSVASLTDSFFSEAATLMAISFVSWEVNLTDFFVFWEEIQSDFSSVSLAVSLTDFSFVLEVN